MFTSAPLLISVSTMCWPEGVPAASISAVIFAVATLVAQVVLMSAIAFISAPASSRIFMGSKSLTPTACIRAVTPKGTILPAELHSCWNLRSISPCARNSFLLTSAPASMSILKTPGCCHLLTLCKSARSLTLMVPSWISIWTASVFPALHACSSTLRPWSQICASGRSCRASVKPLSAARQIASRIFQELRLRAWNVWRKSSGQQGWAAAKANGPSPLLLQ
mmetsp:Transcript_1541/g.2512  ORF Transcript_1541/g.2512 Transcript_1541/m.2512 type:complete len:222 (+) Transcript_1541:1933-2598(+)